MVAARRGSAADDGDEDKGLVERVAKTAGEVISTGVDVVATVTASGVAASAEMANVQRGVGPRDRRSSCRGSPRVGAVTRRRCSGRGADREAGDEGGRDGGSGRECA